MKHELLEKTSATNTNSDTESEVPSSTRGTNGALDTKERRVTKNIMRKKKRSKSLSRSMDEELLRDTLAQTTTEERNKTGAANEKKVRTGKAKRKGKTKEKSENGDADELRLNLNLGADASDDEYENVSFGPNLVIPRLDLSGLDQSVTPRSILRLV